MAKAFANSRNFLKKNISRNEERWTWGDVHINEYAAMPWSKTPLKHFFHREVSTAGNSHTPNVSKANLDLKENRFVSTHAANFKMLVSLEASDSHLTPSPKNNLYSIDTGDGSNIFNKHYFDMNEDHLNGNLKPMYMREHISEVNTETLTLNPISNKNKNDL